MLTGAQVAGIIKSHRSQMQKAKVAWDKYRSWFGSDFYGSEQERPQGADNDLDTPPSTFETNYPYSWIDTMTANVCPLNPQLTVSPRRRELADMAEAREALINDTLHRMKTHERLWTMATHASVYQRGFIKVVWDERRNRPKTRNIDPRFVFFDLTAEDWDDLRYIIEVTVVTKQDFDMRLRKRRSGDGAAKKGWYDPKVAEKAVFSGYPDWLKDKTKRRSLLNEASRDVFQWVTIYEVYDFTDDEGHFYHFLEDSEVPLFEGDLPYRFVKNPFRMLTFNENLHDIGGLSDVKLIESAQEQLNELDTLELNHAKASIPAIVFNETAVDNPGELLEAYRTSGQPGTFIGMRLRADQHIGNVMMPTPTASLSPSFQNMKDRAIDTITFTLGIPLYSRGQVGGTDIATEVALADTATRTRNGRRQKSVYDVVEWLGESVIGLYEEFLSNTAVLYVRLTGKKEILQVSRQAMGLNDLKASLNESPLEYDYEAVPYSSVENSRLVQLRNIQSSWNALMWGVEVGMVDPELLMGRLLDLLMISNVVMKPDDQRKLEAQMKAAQAAAPGAAPNASIDRIETGALPPGQEPAAYPTLGGGPGQGTAAPTPIVRGSSAIPEV